jgi:hypothetical protein
MTKDSSKNPAPIAPTSASGVPAAAKARVAKPESGTAVKKKNTASGNNWGKKANRSNKTATGGASYGIRVKIPAYKATEAGATQGNGRLFSPAIKRTAPNSSGTVQK